MLDSEAKDTRSNEHDSSNTKKVIAENNGNTADDERKKEEEGNAAGAAATPVEEEATNGGNKDHNGDDHVVKDEGGKDTTTAEKNESETKEDNGGEADDNKDKAEDDMEANSEDGAPSYVKKEQSDDEDVEMEDAAEKKKPVHGRDEKANEGPTKEEVADDQKDDKSSVSAENDEDKPTQRPEPVKKEREEEGEEKKVDGEKSNAGGAAAAAATTRSDQAPATATTAAPNPPPPVLKGTLSYSEDNRKHLIRGMWNYENSTALPPQRFELYRSLQADEDLKKLPKDGEFNGSFSLAYIHTTSKGKKKERSKVIPESGVKIKFTEVEGTENEFKIEGRGTNQFGIFHLTGTATPSPHDNDPSFNVILRKRYEPSQPPAAAAAAPATAPADGGSKKRKSMTENGAAQDKAANEPLPPPSTSYDRDVVALRGKLYREGLDELGATDVVHRINGMWANGLNLILADPQNVQGLCNRFEYEHKSSNDRGDFPVSGRYSGWFDIRNQDGTKIKVNERDVTLRFQKNSAGYHNVEGRGSNVYGKYTITGTLSLDNVLTLFRHFKPLKLKTKITSAPPPINKGGQARRPSVQQSFPEPLLKLEDVKVPDEDKPASEVEPIKPPSHPSYSAVSQGAFKLNDDGSHTCVGKWAQTREHLTSGQTSSFNFRLEPHFVLEAANDLKKKRGEEPYTVAQDSANPMIPKEFPLDSAMYKGSFQLKKNNGPRYQTFVDQQVVMKFQKNKTGSYNVYGRGQNAIGIFDLIGTLIMLGKTSGQVELFRMYPPELLAAPSVKASAGAAAEASGKVPSFSKPATSGDVAPLPLPVSSMPKTQPVPSSSTILPGPPRGGLLRRESTRLVKLPSRLEDDDPKAQLQRIMEKCNIMLRQMREKDLEMGAFFSEPVDPVALGIPTYRQVVSEPMDLGTVAKKMDADQIDSPEEFARLVRLVFENAMKFNVDPTHSVHITARNLLVLFNQKFRDVERILENLRRNHKGVDIDGKKKKKEDKKRKRSEEPKSLKRRRLDEAQAMATANTDAMSAIVAAAPQGVPNAGVSRGEFNMMIHMIQLLQKQVVQTHNALAELSPGDETDNAMPAGIVSSSHDSYIATSEPAPAPAPVPEKKKSKKKGAESAPKKQQQVAEEPAIVFDETKPLTLAEQETLTETINNMPPDHIPGVIQIIRESASLAGDEDEIDLEIDQLDTVTQRRLLRHVSKYIKQPKRTKSKTGKKSKAAASAPASAPKSQKKTEKAKPPSPKKSDPGSFFAAFGSGKDDSDSDSDDDDDGEPKQTASTGPSGGKHFSPAAAASKSDNFDLGDAFGGLHDDNDDDLANGGITANWDLAKAVAKNSEKDKGGDDDDWGAARKHAEAQEAREADRKAREEKLKAEAEETKKQRLAEAAAQGEKLKAQRAEEEANEQQRKFEKEEEVKKAQEAARAKMRAQVESVEQTVDLDAQRDIMKQYEQSFLDKELGSASPSSDFGF